MNIRQAKEEIKHTVQAYLKKDESGAYRIPGDPPASDLNDGTAGDRKDADHGADRARVQDRAGFLYDHPSHQTECGRPSVYP